MLSPPHRERNIAMTSREAAIYQLKKLKGQPLKKKISYVLTYFWVPIVAVIAAVIFLVSLIAHWTNLKPTAFTLCCINSIANPADVDSYLQDFAQAHDIDTDEYQLTSQMLFLGQGTEEDYQNMQVFSVMLIAGDLDVVAADSTAIVSYAYQEAFVDLSELLTTEQMDALAHHLLYIDASLLEKMNEFSEEAPLYPDPTKPEEMEQPVPVAIMLQPNWEFAKVCYPYTYGETAVGLVSNAKNSINAEAFLQYILVEKEN